jgi:uncharacterized membrane protein YccC
MRVGRLSGQELRLAVAESAGLGVACLVSFVVVAQLLSRVHSVDQRDNELGALWAVISTIFVLRASYTDSISAAVSRMTATLVSFAFCLVYLVFLPFHDWALALLTGLSALALRLAGRPGDGVTAAITTAVVLIVADVSPHEAWQQPILRLADTAVGVAVGVAAAWIGLRIIRPRLAPRPARPGADGSRP